MTKKRRKRVVGSYILDKMDRRPRGEEAVMKIIKMDKKRRKSLKKIMNKYEQKQLVFQYNKKIIPNNKPSKLKEGNIVRIFIKTQYGIGRIGKIDEVRKDEAYIKVIFRDGIYLMEFPFKLFAIEKANRKEKRSYEMLEERLCAKEVAEKL
jgi:hypothetical protein